MLRPSPGMITSCPGMSARWSGNDRAWFGEIAPVSLEIATCSREVASCSGKLRCSSWRAGTSRARDQASTVNDRALPAKARELPASDRTLSEKDLILPTRGRLSLASESPIRLNANTIKELPHHRCRLTRPQAHGRPRPASRRGAAREDHRGGDHPEGARCLSAGLRGASSSSPPRRSSISGRASSRPSASRRPTTRTGDASSAIASCDPSGRFERPTARQGSCGTPRVASQVVFRTRRASVPDVIALPRRLVSCARPESA